MATTRNVMPGHAATKAEPIIDCCIKTLHYGKFKAVRDTHIPIYRGTVTAFIGPSGCGKSTALRCLNRMNDLVRGFRFEGHVQFPRQGHLSPHGRSGGRPPLHRHGVPAAESVRHEHLQQRRLRLADQPLQGEHRRKGRRSTARRRPCGTK